MNSGTAVNMNTNTNPDLQIVRIDEIAARVKICTLNTSCWRATRLHRDETDEENKRHGLKTNAARVLIRVSDHPSLHELQKLHARAYIEHKRLTLPSVQDGMRMVPVGREFEHSKKMLHFYNEHESHVRKFLLDYTKEKTNAPVKLSGLYDPRMWPDEQEIQYKFGFHTRYLSCPTDGEWGDWLKESARAADAELSSRIQEALKRVAERCGDVDGKLYQSVFGNLRDLIELIPDLDLVGKYSQVAQQAIELAKYDAEEVREDKTERERIAKRANDLLGVFGEL